MPHTYAIFSALYPPHTGGIEAYTRNLARELVRGGDRVVVVTSDVGGAPAREVDEAGALVLRTPCRPLMGARFPVMRRNAAFRAAIAELDAASPDFVVVNARFYPLSVFGARWARGRGIAPVIIDHGSAHLTAGNPLVDRAVERVEHLMTNRQKRAGGTYFGVSRASCEWLSHFGIEARGVLPNAIDAAAFRAQASARDFRRELGVADDDLLVAFTGRLEPEKGPDRIVEAARILEDRRRAAGENGGSRGGERTPQPARTVFALAGAGSMRESLEAAAPKTVRFTGPLASPDVAALLSAADAFCLPTRSEGFSTSLLEAAACGCAPVITDVGGVAELIGSAAERCSSETLDAQSENARLSGEASDRLSVEARIAQHDSPCCIVLPDRAPETVADAIGRLACDKQAARAMGAAARMRVEASCTWEKTAEAVRRACADAQRPSA